MKQAGIEKTNIFDIVNLKQSPELEIKRIHELLHKDGGVYVVDEIFSAFTDGTPTSVMKYIDDRLFKSWLQRGTCIDCADFERTIGIDSLPTTDAEATNTYILIFCEYAANMIYLLRQKMRKKDTITNIVDAAEDNIKKFLAWYNYEPKYYTDLEKVLVVPKNAAVSVIVENTKDASLAYSIVEYNHHLLRGNIERKKAILLAMGSDLEPRRKELAELQKKTEDSIFYLLNKLDIRHNNRKKGDRNYVEKVAKMRKQTLEKWYDELYVLMLTAYMLLDNKDRLSKVDTLKAEIMGTP